MTFNHLNRRTHVYLSLSLLPWFLVYALSSLAIHHRSLFTEDPRAHWTPRFERNCHRPVPDGQLRTTAAAILADNDLEGLFRVRRPNPQRLRITRFDFWSQTRLNYHGAIPARSGGFEFRGCRNLSRAFNLHPFKGWVVSVVGCICRLVLRNEPTAFLRYSHLYRPPLVNPREVVRLFHREAKAALDTFFQRLKLHDQEYRAGQDQSQADGEGPSSRRRAPL